MVYGRRELLVQFLVLLLKMAHSIFEFMNFWLVLGSLDGEKRAGVELGLFLRVEDE